MRTFHLPNGSSVEFARKGVGYDVYLRNSVGETTATIHATDEEAYEYMGRLADAAR